MLVSLYTVRVVLNTLGVQDYGIYNVTAGVVTMFGFLSGAIAAAGQRYFSFELGRKDYEQLKKVFSLSLIIYLLIAVTVLLFDSINEFEFLKNINLRSRKIYFLFKQTVDVILALMLFTISLPFWSLIILLIKIESYGPVFSKQKCIGYLEQPFTSIKFRTMRISDNTQEPTINDDSRVTKFGKFLHRTRINEIPQFLNIIKSDMSFIGPRPEQPELILKLEAEVPFYRLRLLVKPGISGWDQVSGEYHSPSKEDTYKKLQYDLYYIKNMSFFLDVSIFFKTLVTVIKRKGV